MSALTGNETFGYEPSCPGSYIKSSSAWNSPGPSWFMKSPVLDPDPTGNARFARESMEWFAQDTAFRWASYMEKRAERRAVRYAAQAESDAVFWAEQLGKYRWRPPLNITSSKEPENLPVYKLNENGTYTEITEQVGSAAAHLVNSGYIDRLLKALDKIESKPAYANPLVPTVNGFQNASDQHQSWPKESYVLTETDLGDVARRDFTNLRVPSPWLEMVTRLDFSHSDPHFNFDFVVRSRDTDRHVDITDIFRRNKMPGHFVPIPELKVSRLEDYKTEWGTYDLQRLLKDRGVDLKK